MAICEREPIPGNTAVSASPRGSKLMVRAILWRGEEYPASFQTHSRCIYTYVNMALQFPGTRGSRRCFCGLDARDGTYIHLKSTAFPFFDLLPLRFTKFITCNETTFQARFEDVPWQVSWIEGAFPSPVRDNWLQQAWSQPQFLP